MDDTQFLLFKESLQEYLDLDIILNFCAAGCQEPPLLVYCPMHMPEVKAYLLSVQKLINLPSSQI